MPIGRCLVHDDFGDLAVALIEPQVFSSYIEGNWLESCIEIGFVTNRMQMKEGVDERLLNDFFCDGG